MIIGLLARPRTGELIANTYRLGEEIGRGGAGVVFAAEHVELAHRVAVKFLQTTDDVVSLERFRREARAAARIQHEHATRMIDFGEHAGAPYLVMEYLEGRDLDAVLQCDGPLPIEDAVQYALEVCEALAMAHAQGIVHRDIKPANLFLASRGDGWRTIKLLDFGISKLIDPDAQSPALTAASWIGSPQYMAPEQLQRALDLDGRSDIWALGITLFELLTGAIPFATGSIPLTCTQILKHEPASLRERRPDASPLLEAIIGRCLAKPRDARWQTVRELATALRLTRHRAVLRIAPGTLPLTQLDLDPRAAFLLSRLDGDVVVDELLDISGMSLVDTIQVAVELVARGIAQLEVRVSRRATTLDDS